MSSLNLIMYMLCIFQLGKLVQVSGNTEICSNEIAVLWCTSDLGFLIWEFMTRTGASNTLLLTGQLGSQQNLTLDSSQILGQVTSINSGFINATDTITRAINGTIIMCNRDVLTLNIPIGKFLSPP